MIMMRYKQSHKFSARNKDYDYFMLLVLLLIGRAVETCALHRETQSTAKTITNNDEAIDCVDIYKQPGLDDPLLRNHTIEMRPSLNMKINKSYIHSEELAFGTAWQRHGGCPNGTVPVRRIDRRYIHRDVISQNGNIKIEVALVHSEAGPFYGVQGKLNIWDIPVVRDEWSLNYISVTSDDGSFIEAGWAVAPHVYSNNEIRFYVRWQDASSGKGCFDKLCPGFVHVSTKFYPGQNFFPSSQYGGTQRALDVLIYKDNMQDKWWVLLLGEAVGYIPSNVFANFNNAAKVTWGGSVRNTESNALHSTSQMGSGHFPREGFGRAAFIRNIQYMDWDKKWNPPHDVTFESTHDGCYKVMGGTWYTGDLGPTIYYGGPGGTCCDGRCKK